MEFKDRDAAYAIRKKLTPVADQPNVYDLTDVSDIPDVSKGTPLDKAHFEKGNWRDEDTLSFASSVYYNSVVPKTPELNVTQIYTEPDGATVVVPPANTGESYRLSEGHDILNGLRDPTTAQTTALQTILDHIFNIMTQPIEAQAYDNLNLKAATYENAGIKAMDYDMFGKAKCNALSN